MKGNFSSGPSGIPLLPKHLQRKVQASLIYLSLFLLILSLSVGIYKGGVHLIELRAEEVDLSELPSALFLSLIRMLISYLFALVFSFVLGMVAATYRWGERVIIPLLDILQSIPVVGFFPAAITFFISLTDGHRMGVEFAACFLIFTSQAWNMAFAVYESVKSIPKDHVEAVSSFGVSGSQKFWKLYAPFCTPRLVYNSILSWSNGWFFLVACEIIAIGPARYHLPGIGSFLALAAEQNEVNLVFWGLIALTALILLMDYLIWRPISVWSERFKPDSSSTGSDQIAFHFFPKFILSALKPIYPFYPWVRQFVGVLVYPISYLFRVILVPLFWDLPASFLKGIALRVYSLLSFRRVKRRMIRFSEQQKFSTFLNRVALTFLVLFAIGAILSTIYWFDGTLPDIAKEIPFALLASTGRLVVVLALSLIWIIPTVLFLWNKPRLKQAFTTLAQIGASLPAIALFPLFILIIVQRMGGGMEVASILLLMTGMQWYLLFNCLGGTSAISSEIHDATRSFGLSKILTWRRLIIPTMTPAMITGSITAWGGGWNALVVAEYVVHKDQVLMVEGIGALLNKAVYLDGDSRAIALCIAAMVAWIIFLNVVFWHPVYRWAIDKFKLEAVS